MCPARWSSPLNEHDIDCAAVLKVLADQTRLAVVRQLIAGPQQVNELNAALQLEQSLLSHHLRILRDADMVTSERIGKAVRYRLADHVAAATDEERTLALGCCNLSFPQD